MRLYKILLTIVTLILLLALFLNRTYCVSLDGCVNESSKYRYINNLIFGFGFPFLIYFILLFGINLKYKKHEDYNYNFIIISILITLIFDFIHQFYLDYNNDSLRQFTFTILGLPFFLLYVLWFKNKKRNL